MDNTINSTIIEKVIIKGVTIYKAIDMLSEPPFEDKSKKEKICQTNEITLKQNLETCLNEQEKKIETQLEDITNEIEKKNEIEKFKNITQIKSGIYKIINKIDGKYYIGSSINLLKRFYKHKLELRKNTHHNKKLQNAWNKYGEHNFEFLIIKNVLPECLRIIEQVYLNICKNDLDNTYNHSHNSFAFNKLCKHTDETKEKISNTHKLKGTNRGNKNYFYGKKFIYRAAGNLSPSYGKKWSEERILNHPNIDNKIYKFYNIKTQENFSGTRREFRNKYTLKSQVVDGLVRKEKKSYKNWILIQKL